MKSFLDTLIQKIFIYIIKIIIFRGELTDISAKKEALLCTGSMCEDNSATSLTLQRFPSSGKWTPEASGSRYVCNCFLYQRVPIKSDTVSELENCCWHLVQGLTLGSSESAFKFWKNVFWMPCLETVFVQCKHHHITQMVTGFKTCLKNTVCAYLPVTRYCMCQLDFENLGLMS